MNPFAGIFWLVLPQLQNRFFVEHLTVAAYVRCLKEKEWKKWNSVFLLYSVWHSALWHCKVQSGKKQYKNISALKMKKKLRTASLKQNFLVLVKKGVYWGKVSDFMAGITLNIGKLVKQKEVTWTTLILRGRLSFFLRGEANISRFRKKFTSCYFANKPNKVKVNTEVLEVSYKHSSKFCYWFLN